VLVGCEAGVWGGGLGGGVIVVVEVLGIQGLALFGDAVEEAGVGVVGDGVAVGVELVDVEVEVGV